VSTLDLRHLARAAVDAKTKPPGSLGRLEELAVEIAVRQGTLRPEVDPVRLVVFAGDHGVVAEGVSAYPAEVTAQMMANFAAGGAAACVFAKVMGVGLEVVDVGVAAPMDHLTGIVHAKVSNGTANLATSAAMSESQLESALEAGRYAARRAIHDGCRCLALGEMGIGNSTAAACLVSAFTGTPPEQTVGPGAGLDDNGLAQKRAVVARALERHACPGAGPLQILARLGGLEIAAMTGAALEASRRGALVIVDGYIASAAILAAVRLDPSIRSALVFAHRSAERGHVVALAALQARPLLDLDLRLGEGTGALLAVPLLRAACAMLREMATFAGAGIAGPSL
jgi:nicotinate-nucleotide--dimethylbenzimidazole phosphoribosyltransferase